MNNEEKIISNWLMYNTPEGGVKVEILAKDETLWLTQQKMATLFDVDRSVITKHLSNIFKEEELHKDSVCAIFAHTANDGKTYQTNFYNLDAIISVGYRVSSKQATRFRIWATSVLREYLIKGFAMDDERLKNPSQPFGEDYFDEQVERIREIRSSERRFYQKITDIYMQCSADYDVNEQTTKDFFATVQNKLHWAITGHTAAELIAARADASHPNMGLTTWKNAPSGKIRKTDVPVAKNYLNSDEMDGLNRIVTMYLDYAENQAKKGVVMHMNDWVDKLNAFLDFNDEAILKHKGNVSHTVAKKLAETQFEKFKIAQDNILESDFDIQLKNRLNQ